MRIEKKKKQLAAYFQLSARQSESKLRRQNAQTIAKRYAAPQTQKTTAASKNPRDKIASGANSSIAVLKLADCARARRRRRRRRRRRKSRDNQKVGGTIARAFCRSSTNKRLPDVE